MNKDLLVKAAPIVALVASLFAAAIAFRPVLPIDETRYLTVAWELFLHHDYSMPTLNFEPYHHKPPMLFFLINMSWEIFGVSRWAALVPFFIAGLLHIFLTRKLAVRLFPEHRQMHEHLPYLTLASAPFLIYGTIVMFDILLTVFILGFYLAALSYLEKPKVWKIIVAGLLLGLGGTTKGPVVLLYTLMPLALLGAWERHEGITRFPRAWTKLIGLSLLIGLIPVTIWLLDLFFETGPAFFKTLIFTQTLDRINGKMESSHARPVYFYLMFLPVLFLPWALFPAFWQNAKSILSMLKTRFGLKLIVLWFGACLVIFSLISGKQPHYLVPLLPAVIIFIALCLEKINLRILQATAVALVLLVGAGQAVAQKYVFHLYDLSRFAQIIADNPERDWAFVRKYQGELGFIGRINHHIDSLEFDEIDAWFEQHPDGFMIIRHHPEYEVPKHKQVYVMPYRSRALGIFVNNDKVAPLKNLPEMPQE